MMLQNHLLAGYFISKIAPNPIIGLPLALLSHYALDLITYPSKEMEISLQSDLKTDRDKVTLVFSTSFLILLSLLTIAVIYLKHDLTLRTGVYLVVANLPDFFGQLIPMAKQQRKAANYDHRFEVTKNPYLKIVVHQLATVSGFLYLLFA